VRPEVKALVNDPKPSSEPAINYGALVTILVSLVGLVLSYLFPHLSTETKYYITTVIAVLVPLITGLLIRFKVWSPATVQKVIEEITEEASQIKPIPTKPQPPKLL
jgi:hypothetical protein